MRWLIYGMCAWLLAGCAAPRPSAQLDPVVWQDQAFAYDPRMVEETRDSVFALAPELVQQLQKQDRWGFTTQVRLDQLLSQLYGAQGISLAYTSGHTTGAAQTWRNKRGDCLSLTILAYAAARQLGIKATMQEVQVPVAVDRREGVDFINGHVNVVVRSDSIVVIDGRDYGAGDFIIDFEPQVGSRRRGDRLTESDILARFYNNRASEYLVRSDNTRAYAYYRAAVAAAPRFAPAYANLAQLYMRQGLYGPAEQLLDYALDLNGPGYAPLRTMHQLMVLQGRRDDAQRYEALLAQRKDEDPYYWLGEGVAALQNGRNGVAVRALERALELTSGFAEIHYQLGLAYYRSGRHEAARAQLAALRALNAADQGVAILSRKLQASTPS